MPIWCTTDCNPRPVCAPAQPGGCTDVTLDGIYDYITISGQVITRHQIDLATDVLGNLAVSHLDSGTNASATTFWRGDGAWVVPAGSGDVSKVGTPVDNQVGVWTGDGTIEGDVNFTFDTGTDTLTTVNIVVSGTVDGRDVATDGLKLDGIEALADVTDTVNVTAAGALMDSEVDADIKTLVLPASTTISPWGATLVDDADAAAGRETIELGTLVSVPRTFDAMHKYQVDLIADSANITLNLSTGLQTREYKMVNGATPVPFVISSITLTLAGEGDYASIEFNNEYIVDTSGWIGVGGVIPDTNTSGSTLVTIREGHFGLEFVT
jgi:hypothetical protein